MTKHRDSYYQRIRYRASLVAAVIIVLSGFKLLSEPGQIIQNDGYAMTGGVVVLLGGFIAGHEIARKARQK